MDLYEIHEKKLIHKDLHLGNIKKARKLVITDLGLCRPVSIEATKKGVYGVLPYMAPEILRGQPYSLASNILYIHLVYLLQNYFGTNTISKIDLMIIY